MKPEPVEVRCKQGPAPAPPSLPKKDEWVEWVPSIDGPGAARLSQKAADWVVAMLAAYRGAEGLRTVEHECLDKLQEKGLIRQ